MADSPKCPECETALERLTEITGYHYWMCSNSACPSSYKYYKNKTAATSPPWCKKCSGFHEANEECY